MIRFENLEVTFNNNTIIKNLNFDVAKGDKLLIYGKSGIGKTTIFRLLLGFEKIQKGSIYFLGKPLNEKTVWELRKKIAYVSQDLDIGGGNVFNLIRNIFSYKTNINVPFDKERLKELLSFFRLKKDILDDDYEKLSGGEKQRIALIIAILLNRDIFLLDEATSALDNELKEKVIEYFIGNKNWTVLAIAHDRHWLNQPGLKIIKIGD